jgi:hypothetical protein
MHRTRAKFFNDFCARRDIIFGVRSRQSAKRRIGAMAL